jgi:hypothetical protein
VSKASDLIGPKFLRRALIGRHVFKLFWKKVPDGKIDFCGGGIKQFVIVRAAMAFKAVVLLSGFLSVFHGSAARGQVCEDDVGGCQKDPPFNLTVIVLTMNRPKSLARSNLQINVHTYQQGDQIERIFAHWVGIYFWQVF